MRRWDRPGELVPGLKALTDAVHSAGARIFVQLIRRASNSSVTGSELVAPSLPCKMMQEKPVR